MRTSIFDLFRIGIGPSSSHTVGPMRAARRFAETLAADGALERTAAVTVHLYGSLALTGRGHGTDRAVVLGLLGEAPDTVDPAAIDGLVAGVRAAGAVHLLGRREARFGDDAIVWHRQETLPAHSNGMRFTACGADGATLAERVYYSVGGGFIEEAGVPAAAGDARAPAPYPFASAQELLRVGRETGWPLWRVVLANESAWRPEPEVRAGVARIWDVMRACMERGLATGGVLPGGLNVRRRAPMLQARLAARRDDPLAAMDLVNVFAIAVNEENAGGGRVVTAPTNGAAGVIPAVARYYETLVAGADAEGLFRFFLTAGAIGVLYKENASISGAEVGCQGEVGVACSMAAGGLVAALEGSNEEVEHAAEIGMEHNLGMTCDPIGGLVQIPCIERNAFGAVKAINAARMAMTEEGDHKVPLDSVIRTMFETGRDMQARYKETALGGLAVNVVEC